MADKLSTYNDIIKAIEKGDFGVGYLSEDSYAPLVAIKTTIQGQENFYRIDIDWNGKVQMSATHSIDFASAEYPEDFQDKFQNLVESVDVSAVFRQMYSDSMDILAEKLPVVFNFVHGCILEEDYDAGTLYATYDELLGDFAIHYNPDFVVKMALSDAIVNDNKLEVLKNTFAFLMAHEAFHVLKYHINNQTGATTDIDHHLANILEDSFINTELKGVFQVPGGKVRTLSMGVDNNLTFTGEVNALYKNLREILSDIAQIFRVNGKAPNTSIRIPQGSTGAIRIAYKPEALEKIWGGNSNLFVRALALISTKIILKPKVDYNRLLDMLKDLAEQMSGEGTDGGSSSSGAGGGSQSGGSSGGGEGSSNPSDSTEVNQPEGVGAGSGEDSDDYGDEGSDGAGGSDSSDDEGSDGAGGGDSDSSGEDDGGDSGGSSSNSDGSDGQSGGSSGQSGGNGAGSGESHNKPKSKGVFSDLAKDIASGDNNRESSEKSMDELAESKSKVKDKMVQAVKTAKEENPNLNNSKEQSLIDGMGLTKGIPNMSTVGSWKNTLRKCLSDCLGTDESYNPNLPSARVEGQLGRDEDIQVPFSICLLIDKSGSMDISKWKDALNEIEVFLKASRMKNVKVHLIFWGTQSYYYKLTSTKDLIKNIRARDQDCGGTDYNYGLDEVRAHCKRCDAYLCFTDGEIFSPLTPENEMMLKKIRKRHIWIMTKSGYDKRWILRTDPTAKNRIIVPK